MGCMVKIHLDSMKGDEQNKPPPKITMTHLIIFSDHVLTRDSCVFFTSTLYVVVVTCKCKCMWEHCIKIEKGATV